MRLQFQLPPPRWAARAIDRLFGYDVFVAHRRVDAAGYAARLVARLDQEKLSSFIDVREYGPGDDLSSATLRHIRKATMLVVLGSPSTLEPREPDWVLAEIDAYQEANPGDALRLLPIDFGGTLAHGTERSTIAARLRDVIRLDQPLAALDAEPSTEVIDAIARQFRYRRRDTVRLRVFQGIAGVLGALLLASVASAWLANRALGDARRNLAANDMTAAGARLADGFRDEAAALAAESLRHADSDEARRLITENPPLDLSNVRSVEAASGFAVDVDAAGTRWAAAGYDGRLTLVELRPGGARTDAWLGRTDLWAVAFTPDGERVFAGDDKGRLFVRSARDPALSPCERLPMFDDRISRFAFMPAGGGVLVNAGGALWQVDLQAGCPLGAPRLLYRSPSAAFEFVVDAPRQRIVLADNDGLVRLALPGAAPVGSSASIDGAEARDAGPPQRVVLPIPPGRSERPQPSHIALDPVSGRLCVLTLGGDELLYLDEQLAVTAPLAQRPFGTAKPPVHVPLFAFDARGQRLVIVDDDGQAIVWAVASGSAERRLRLHGSHLDAASLHAGRVISLGNERPLSGSARSELRQVDIDAPGSVPVGLMGLNASSAPQVRSLERSPRGHEVLVAADDGPVLAFDFGSGRLSEAALPGDPAGWVSRSPDGQRIATFGRGAEVRLVEAGRLLRRYSFLEQGDVGLDTAAWLADGSALAVGGGWKPPWLLPVDPARPVLVGPVTSGSDIKSLVAGPAGHVLVRDSAHIWNWDTRANTMVPIDLVGRDSLAVSDLAPWGRDGVAVLTREGLFLWHWRENGALERSAELRLRGDAMVIDASGRRLALLHRGEMDVHDLPTGALRASLSFGRGDVYAAAFEDGGGRLLGGLGEQPFRLWSLHALDTPARALADRTQAATGRVGSNFALTLPTTLPDAKGR